MINTRQRYARRLQTLLGACVLVLWLIPYAAVADGDFEIENANTYQSDGVFFIDADIDYILNKTALEALTSGVALTFEMMIEVYRERRWRPDKNVAELLQLYELQYHALSERYIVRNLNSGTQGNYLTLSAALRDLGYVRRLPLLDAALLNPSRDYRVRIRSVLDIRSFPGPLRLFAVFFGDWRLASDWHELQLFP